MNELCSHNHEAFSAKAPNRGNDHPQEQVQNAEKRNKVAQDMDIRASHMFVLACTRHLWCLLQLPWETGCGDWLAGSPESFTSLWHLWHLYI